MKTPSQDLSIVSGLDLIKVSLNLRERTAAPYPLGLEVGIYRGRFYQIDFTMNRVIRITLGAFRHLSDAWRRDRHVADALHIGMQEEA